jgi:mannose-1-phosphate guanylyltransferase
MIKTKILIMAGGVGSRFWPQSTEQRPKQFIDVLGVGKSLLQMTVERFVREYSLEDIYILTNRCYFELVEEQLPQLPSSNIFIEPSRNNTAPCIAYASFKIFAEDRDSVMVVVPSDHLILKEEEYLDSVKAAINFAFTREAILTLGITPTRPETGYGYIRYSSSMSEEVLKVNEFLEKPKLELAKAYLASGKYLWNAGMFIWRSSTIIEALKIHAPDIYEIFSAGAGLYNSEDEKEYINLNYEKCPNISIDYAVLEKADNVYTIKADIGWSDLGTWGSLSQVLPKDANGNAGNLSNVILVDSRDNLVRVQDNKKVLVRGLNDYIVVDTSYALLIYPKKHEQEIRVHANLG